MPGPADAAWRGHGRTEALIKTGKVPDVSIRAAQRNYKKALEKGLLKIMSKVRAGRPPARLPAWLACWGQTT